MNNSFPRLIDGMVSVLREGVLPSLQGDFLRGQVYGVIYILNHLKVRGDWSAAWLGEELAAQHKLIGDVVRLAEGASVPPPVSTGEFSPPVTAGVLEAQRNAGNQQVGELLTWFQQHGAELAPAAREAIDAALRDYMREEVRIEMRHTARSMFAEMSQNSEG